MCTCIQSMYISVLKAGRPQKRYIATNNTKDKEKANMNIISKTENTFHSKVKLNPAWHSRDGLINCIVASQQLCKSHTISILC